MKNTHQTLSQWRDKFNSKNIDYTLTQINEGMNNQAQSTPKQQWEGMSRNEKMDLVKSSLDRLDVESSTETDEMEDKLTEMVRDIMIDILRNR